MRPVSTSKHTARKAIRYMAPLLYGFRLMLGAPNKDSQSQEHQAETKSGAAVTAPDSNSRQPSSAQCARIASNSSATMLVILIAGFTAGPAVSLYGSPTVSPVTEALCASEPLPPKWPSSMYFLALSQAPPPVHMEMATKRPVTMVPMSTPPSACAPA